MVHIASLVTSSEIFEDKIHIFRYDATILAVVQIVEFCYSFWSSLTSFWEISFRGFNRSFVSHCPSATMDSYTAALGLFRFVVGFLSLLARPANALVLAFALGIFELQTRLEGAHRLIVLTF